MITYKTFAELTETEKSELRVPSNNKISDYQDFQVRYNKKGDFLGIKPNKFTEKKADEIEQESLKPDVLDACWVTFGSFKQKEFWIAYKKVLAYDESKK